MLDLSPQSCVFLLLHEQFLQQQILILLLYLKLRLEGGILLHKGLILLIDLMRNILDPLQLRGHLLLLLLILLIFLVLIDPIFFELVLYFVDFLVEEPADVGLLLDEDL